MDAKVFSKREINKGLETHEQAEQFFIKTRWPNGVRCPLCNKGKTVSPVQQKNVKSKRSRKHLILFQCGKCQKQFTVTTGTIFEQTHIPLNKWFMAIQLLCASKKGMSTKELSELLGVSIKSTWFMTHRIRGAMSEQPFKRMFKGKVEADETYVGGKPRPGTGKHKRGRGTKKIPVLLLVERDGKAYSQPITDVSAETLKGAIRELVHKDSTILTDEWKGYIGIGKYFTGGHHAVKHKKKQYARGDIHSNTAESYFAIMKRGIKGVYHAVSKRHLAKYCNEYSFRWNNRKQSSASAVIAVIKQSKNKRMIYRQVISKRMPKPVKFRKIAA